MKLMDLPGGDTLHHYKKSLVLCFAGPRDVLSTGPIGGGFRTDLQAVFNNDCNPGAGMSCELRADTYVKHMELLALKDLGLDPAFQHNILNRMDRFGITEDDIWRTYLQRLSEKEKNLSPFVRAEFEDRLSQLCRENTLVTYSSLYAHLMDQLDWKLLSPEEALPAGKQLLGLAGIPTNTHCSCSDDQDLIAKMADFYLQGLMKLLMIKR